MRIRARLFREKAMAILLGNPISLLFLGFFLFLSASWTEASFSSSELR